MRPGISVPPQQLDHFSRWIHTNNVTRLNTVQRITRPAFGDRDVRKYRTLHHHRVGDAEDECFRRKAFVANIVESPSGGDAAFRRREKQDFVADVEPLQLVTGLGDESAPAIEVVPRTETFGRHERFAFDSRAKPSVNLYRQQHLAHRSTPVTAMSTQSVVRRRIVLNL